MDDNDLHREAAASGDLASVDVERVIPVIAETLQVDRRTLEGVVRVRKTVHEQPVVLDETAREERIAIERVAIGRPVEGPVAIRQEGDVTIVPVLEERLVVEKRLVLVEELHLKRQIVTRRVPQQVTVRREQVVVERFDPRTQAWTVLDAPPVADLAPHASRLDDEAPAREQPARDAAGFPAPAEDATR